jgi:hypothetical protein
MTEPGKSSVVFPKLRPAAIYSRRRAANACIVCRARKTKCDGERPVCGFCKVSGGNCRYAESDASKLDPGSLIILTRIGQLEESLKAYINKSLELQDRHSIMHRSVSSSGLSTLSSDDGFPRQLHGHGGQQEQFHASPDLSLPKNDSTVLLEDVPPSTEILLHASEMSFEAVLRWPIFSELVPHLAADLHTPTVEVLAHETQIATLSEQDISTALQNLTSEVVNDLVENFLANNHVKNPVLDVGLLRIDAREFNESGPQWNGRTCLLVRSHSICTENDFITSSVVACVRSQQFVEPFGSRTRTWDLKIS